jgi:hypothetical protein
MFIVDCCFGSEQRFLQSIYAFVGKACQLEISPYLNRSRGHFPRDALYKGLPLLLCDGDLVENSLGVAKSMRCEGDWEYFMIRRKASKACPNLS